MFNGSVCVWDKAVPNPAAAPVAFDISPTKLVAVIIPEKVALPLFETVAPVPKLTPVECKNVSPTVNPVLCKLDDPLLKF